jgi:hypothetical protein
MTCEPVLPIKNPATFCIYIFFIFSYILSQKSTGSTGKALKPTPFVVCSSLCPKNDTGQTQVTQANNHYKAV